MSDQQFTRKWNKHTHTVINDGSISSTWQHLRCDVGLEEGEYQQSCLCATVLCTIIVVHTSTSCTYVGRLHRALILLCLALCLPSTSLRCDVGLEEGEY